ncbi:TPA: patatin-like phospholipase family protein [Stenotrophomonas maltophilia]|nr:patatin-like phospholipase family protein [Stenotrophomonas maltophilia]HDS1024833.1 patatin-like phospholipase family protein [Stenotrophomonas maltophilia]HDS1028877.1 patatin-like phospholipase family protein [Stenotrophomonas maltophilia]HDS1032999.1 patatin-like phospholipase family protein [Stenotrophomonas maltophilia]
MHMHAAGRFRCRWHRWAWPAAFLLLTAVAPAMANEAPIAQPRTCLVLGGGGARGAAHIGLLKVLERERVQVDCIVGTSMGAIVGGLYASGYRAAEIEQILDRIDWSEVLHDKPPRNERSMRRKEDDLRLLGGVEVGVRDGKIAFPRGLIQGQKLEALLRELLLPVAQVKDFDALPIPFRAIATDIVNGDKVVFAQGDLATAIRASMSVPGIFAPVRVDGRVLVDGGVVDNVPIDEARVLGAQRMIVSRVGSPLLTADQLDSPLAISHQMANVLMAREVQAQIATLGPDDLLIVPDLGTMGSQDFNRSPQAVGLGEQAAEQSLAGIRRFSVDAPAYARFQERHRLPDYQPPQLSFVAVDDAATRTPRFIRERLASEVGQPLAPERVKQKVAEIYGEGRYEQVQWRLAQRDGLSGLAVDAQDKAWGPDYLHFALRVSDDFDGDSNYQLITEYTRTGLSEQGAELKLRASLGQVQELFTEYYRPMGANGRSALSLYGQYRATEEDLDLVAGNTFARFRYSQWLGGVRWAYSPRHDWEAAVFAERGHERLRLDVGDRSQLNNYNAALGSVALQLRHDSIDSSAFPRHGQRLSLTHQHYLEAMGSRASAQVFRVQWDAAWSHGENRWLGGLRASSTHGDDLLASYGFLGGLGNLSGYAEEEIFAPQTALARLIYYRRLTHADSLLTVPVYVGGSAEWGGYWNSRSDVGVDGMQGAGSLFVGMDTFLGPVFLGYGRAKGGHQAFYLTFGSLLRTLDGF